MKVEETKVEKAVREANRLAATFDPLIDCHARGALFVEIFHYLLAEYKEQENGPDAVAEGQEGHGGGSG